jgi:hypothetical protein
MSVLVRLLVLDPLAESTLLLRTLLGLGCGDSSSVDFLYLGIDAMFFSTKLILLRRNRGVLSLLLESLRDSGLVVEPDVLELA